MESDRRTAPRIPCSIRVTLLFRNGFIHNVPVIDLSLSGIRLELDPNTTLPFATQAALHLFFSCDTQSQASACLLQLPCRIIWANTHAVALQFICAEQESQQLLATLLASDSLHPEPQHSRNLP
ncbi:PilZ domain-containing protein [Candidatus Magnetaquicoccus inordinatus]|uniref:PilZ domain-containing protein n=1 Tax=Candidatus Magnetaquicoccus inordinatus TaxID=2496818 RepID=UPI00102CCADB|nr:PilZ domain-containing protein [Candidatus Magnetaquicoccus inordinatus]